MNAAVDIHPLALLAGYVMLLIPLGIIYWYRVPMLGQTLMSVLRMTLQLIFVGLYLQVVFRLNHFGLNILWLAVMITVADLSILRGCQLRLGRIAGWIFLALLAGTAVPLLVFVGVILRRPEILDARFVIPIGGMILGNCLRADIVGIRTFYQSIRTGQKAYELSLSQGATVTEAVQPHLRETLYQSLTPTVAMMANVGIVALPGMMTGVILGGNDPLTAIGYQIAIMLSIFTGTSITVILAILFSARSAFSAYGILRPEIFK
ncbi:MAG: ABC transporter permease [Planctomycetes bacterium]|nr:ABC transporter permease [Planctomycetota bacterium]